MQKEISGMLTKTKMLLGIAVLVIAVIVLAIGLSIGRQESVQTETPQVVEKQEPLTLLYFFKSGCPGCRKMNPVVAKLEEDYAGFADVERWDVSMPISQMKAQEYNIRGVPTLILVDSADQVLGRWVGYQEPDKIDQLLGWLKSTYHPEGE